MRDEVVPEVEQRLLYAVVAALQTDKVPKRRDVDAVDGAPVTHGDEVEVGNLPRRDQRSDRGGGCEGAGKAETVDGRIHKGADGREEISLSPHCER